MLDPAPKERFLGQWFSANFGSVPSATEAVVERAASAGVTPGARVSHIGPERRLPAELPAIDRYDSS